MDYEHQPFGSPRRSQSLRNDRCQNILYKAMFEHFSERKWFATLLLSSKSFQNSSFGANYVVNNVVDNVSIPLLDSVLAPSSCMSMQFVPSLHVKQWRRHSEKINKRIVIFVGEMVNTKYLHSSLRSLTLDSVTDEILSFFFGSSTSDAWPHLRDLTLENCALPRTVFEIISKSAPQLCAVSFRESSGVTDAGLEHFSELINITSLDLTCCDKITDAGLEQVSQLSNISRLILSQCSKITDAGLDHIAKLHSINSLNLRNCFKITDAGLRHVAALPDITVVNLSFCDLITDAGLEHLAPLIGITSIDLSGCDKITAEARTKLKTALPNCNINHDD